MKFTIKPEEEIVIKFAVGIRNDGQIVGDVSKELLIESFKELVDPNTVEEHQAVFRRPCFGDTVNMGNQINTADGIRMEFNPLAMRRARMAQLIKSWTLVEDVPEKDEETGEVKVVEKPLPADAFTVNSLDPVVANIIGVQLDAAVGI